MSSDIKEGDQVINISPNARRRDPFRVVRVQPIEGSDRRLLHVVRPSAQGKSIRSYLFEGDGIVKLEACQTVQQALRAHVPANQFCEICDSVPAPERHFLTVPIPRAFTRVCPEDAANIQREFRKRTAKIMAEVFAAAKAGRLKKLLQEP